MMRQTPALSIPSPKKVGVVSSMLMQLATVAVPRARLKKSSAA